MFVWGLTHADSGSCRAKADYAKRWGGHVPFCRGSKDTVYLFVSKSRTISSSLSKAMKVAKSLPQWEQLQLGSKASGVRSQVLEGKVLNPKLLALL